MAVLVRARRDVDKLRRDVDKLRAAAAHKRAIVAGRLYRAQFTDAQLRALVTYKNRGVDRSVTYRLVMSPLYDRLARLLPPWLAPNAVTLLGFALVLLSHALLVWYTPHLDTPAPSWVYVVAGVSLFTYMVLDNLDGRQARRTGSSSPLGHLFDHGCDAFNVTISGMSILATLQLVRHPLWAYALLYLTGQVICYVASLEEYFTGAMILREINGPNEGLIVMSVLHVATGVVGPQMWTQTAVRVCGVDLAWNQVLVLGMALPTAWTMVTTFEAIWEDGKRRKQADIVKRSMLASTNIALCGLLNVAWIVLAGDDFRRSVVPVLWLSGLNFFYLISQMIVCHLTGKPFPMLLKSVIPQALCAANAIIGRLFLRGLRTPLPQGGVLWCSLIVTACFNGWRIYCMIKQICDYLNIKCLRLGPLVAAQPPAPAEMMMMMSGGLSEAGLVLPSSSSCSAEDERSSSGALLHDLDGLAPTTGAGAGHGAKRRAGPLPLRSGMSTGTPTSTPRASSRTPSRLVPVPSG